MKLSDLITRTKLRIEELKKEVEMFEDLGRSTRVIRDTLLINEYLLMHLLGRNRSTFYNFHTHGGYNE